MRHNPYRNGDESTLNRLRHSELPLSVDRSTKFMGWWHIVNIILESRGQAELRYGEAKDYWKEYTE